MNDRIVEYQIVSGFEPDLVEQLNNLFLEGWQPYGNLIRDPYGCYYQAVVRCEHKFEYAMRYQTADLELERIR